MSDARIVPFRLIFVAVVATVAGWACLGLTYAEAPLSSVWDEPSLWIGGLLLLLVTVAGAVISVTPVCFRIVRASRLASDRCGHCGYPYAAGRACPECGRSYTFGNIEDSRVAELSRRRRRVAGIWLSACTGMLAYCVLLLAAPLPWVKFGGVSTLAEPIRQHTGEAGLVSFQGRPMVFERLADPSPSVTVAELRTLRRAQIRFHRREYLMPRAQGVIGDEIVADVIVENNRITVLTPQGPSPLVSVDDAVDYMASRLGISDDRRTRDMLISACSSVFQAMGFNVTNMRTVAGIQPNLLRWRRWRQLHWLGWVQLFGGAAIAAAGTLHLVTAFDQACAGRAA